MNRERKLELPTVALLGRRVKSIKKSKGKESPFESLQQVLFKVPVLALSSATAFTIYMVESTNPT